MSYTRQSIKPILYLHESEIKRQQHFINNKIILNITLCNRSYCSLIYPTDDRIRKQEKMIDVGFLWSYGNPSSDERKTEYKEEL